MSLTHEFEYVKAGTVEETVSILAERPGAQVLAGGTDLIPWLIEDLAQPEALVDIKAIDGLDSISVSDRRMTLGCLVTFADLLANADVREQAPLLFEMAGQVASTGIRNRATVMGNICSAVPCTDAGSSLMVYDALVHVTSAEGERAIPIEDWFVGPRQTSRNPGELATAISFNLPKRPAGACWVKLGRYRGEDLAQASVAVLALDGDTYRVSFGSVAPRPIRGKAIEAELDGHPLDDDLIARAVALVPDSIAPITDIRATREYRMQMVKVMLERGLETATARRDGNGPGYGTRVI